MSKACFKSSFSDCFIRVVFGLVCFLNEIFDIFIEIRMAKVIDFFLRAEGRHDSEK